MGAVNLRCTLCDHIFEVPAVHAMRSLTGSIYTHLTRKHRLEGRARNIESDRIKLPVRRVP